MRRSAVLLLLLAVSAAPLAAAQARSQMCSYELRYDVTVEGDRLLLQNRDRGTVEIDGDRLRIDGREQALDPAERRRLADYRRQMERFVAATTEVALNGVQLGIESAGLAIAALNGDDGEQRWKQLSERLDGVRARLAQRLDGRHLPASALGDDFDSELDREIEAITEDAVLEMTGSVSRFVFTALFFPSRIEQRAAKLEQLMETQVERRADQLGRDAERLCDDVQRLDVLENSLGRFDALARDEPSI